MNYSKQACAWLVLFVIGTGAILELSGQELSQEKQQLKVVFIERDGAYCPVVGVENRNPILRTRNGLTGPVRSDFDYIIKTAGVPSKGTVLITKRSLQPPPPFIHGPPVGRVAIMAEEDHEELFMVTYLVKKDTAEIGYFWFDAIGALKANEIHKVSIELEGVVIDSWDVLPSYKLEYHFYEKGMPLSVLESPDS